MTIKEDVKTRHPVVSLWLHALALLVYSAVIFGLAVSRFHKKAS